MLVAFLEGKLSKAQENMEDLLTSIVFGVFRREDAAASLLPFLCMAEPQLDYNILSVEQACSADYAAYKFWPKWPNIKGVASCEPDLLITLNVPNGKDILVLIEVKYHSGLSSYATDDEVVTHQLAKEWLQLCHKAGDTYIPWLVFLTTDISKPIQNINDAKNEIKAKIQKHGIRQETNISWLSWRGLGNLFDSRTKTPSSLALSDVSHLIRHLGLIFFDGFTGHVKLPNVNYIFQKTVVHYIWEFYVLPQSKWKFI